jgi:hypothetical protein
MDDDTRAFVDLCSFDDARNVAAKSRHVMRDTADLESLVRIELPVLNVMVPSALQAYSTML